MDRFVKNFIAMSMVYLASASLLGILMLAKPPLMPLKFVHSHLMLLGWVSMMIYGVGYHILPRFAGRLIKNKGLAELQFWLSNISLIGMLLFYALTQYRSQSALYSVLAVVFGTVQVLSIILFFYNMMSTLFGKEAEA